MDKVGSHLAWSQPLGSHDSCTCCVLSFSMFFCLAQFIGSFFKPKGAAAAPATAKRKAEDDASEGARKKQAVAPQPKPAAKSDKKRSAGSDDEDFEQ